MQSWRQVTVVYLYGKIKYYSRSITVFSIYMQFNNYMVGCGAVIYIFVLLKFSTTISKKNYYSKTQSLIFNTKTNAMNLFYDSIKYPKHNIHIYMTNTLTTTKKTCK